MSYQQSPGFFQELKTTPHTEYFGPINLRFIRLFLLQRSSNKNENVVIANLAVIKCAEVKTMGNLNWKDLFVLLVQIFKQPFT